MLFLLVGAIPMRNLVYRVQPLPKSLLSHVWNFGSLNLTSKPPDKEQTENSDNEMEYIMSMVTIFVSFTCLFIVLL